MVHRRREKKEKLKTPIRPIHISSPKRISMSATSAVGSVANRQTQLQKMPLSPPPPPPSARKMPMDRHRDMMVRASNLRQDARLVASQMTGTLSKLELLRALEVSLRCHRLMGLASPGLTS
jgi:hypothetical protein